jgi:hypothetical protein
VLSATVFSHDKHFPAALESVSASHGLTQKKTVSGKPNLAIAAILRRILGES